MKKKCVDNIKAKMNIFLNCFGHNFLMVEIYTFFIATSFEKKNTYFSKILLLCNFTFDNNLSHLPSKHVSVHQAHERNCESKEHPIMWPFCLKSGVIVCNYEEFVMCSQFDVFLPSFELGWQLDIVLHAA